MATYQQLRVQNSLHTTDDVVLHPADFTVEPVGNPVIVVFRYVGHEEVINELRERGPLLGARHADFGVPDLGHVGFEHVIRLVAQLELVHPGADLK